MPFEIGSSGNLIWFQGKPGDPLFRFSPAVAAQLKQAREQTADEELARLLQAPHPSSRDKTQLNFVLLLLQYRMGEITLEEVKTKKGDLSDGELDVLFIALRWAAPGRDTKLILAFMEQVEQRLKRSAKKETSSSPCTHP